MRELAGLRTYLAPNEPRRTPHMNKRTHDHYEQRAAVIKALAHRSRLLMVDTLAQRELSVGELQTLVGADISTVSKHLSVLKRAGIVADRKEGLQVFYRLRIPCIAEFFRCIEAVVEHSGSDSETACCHLPSYSS